MNKEEIYSKPAFTLTVRELVDILKNESLLKETIDPSQTKPIKGIHGLAKFLGISATTAQRLKNEGLFEYFQDGRTLLFDRKTVEDEMKNYKNRKKPI